MPSSSLDIQLSKYWPLLTPVQKKSILDVIKSFASSPEKISLEQYNQELAEAEAEYNEGKYISHEEMLKQIGQW